MADDEEEEEGAGGHMEPDPEGGGACGDLELEAGGEDEEGKDEERPVADFQVFKHRCVLPG